MFSTVHTHNLLEMIFARTTEHGGIQWTKSMQNEISKHNRRKKNVKTDGLQDMEEEEEKV